MDSVVRRPTLRLVAYPALAAVLMAYGWGYRGTVGHEAGAMVPGALLGLALCLGSGRQGQECRTRRPGHREGRSAGSIEATRRSVGPSTA